MKKIFLTMLLLVVLAFGAAQTCLAANVPVYIDDKQLTGWEHEGEVYVSISSALQALGLKPEWNAKTQTVVIAMADGSKLHMTIGQNNAGRFWPDGFVRHYGFDGAPLLRNGSTWVSLESLIFLFNLGADCLDANEQHIYTNKIFWDGWIANGEVYLLDLSSGILSRRQTGQQEAQILAQLSLSERPDLPDEIALLQVERTENGNYLVSYLVTREPYQEQQAVTNYFVDGTNGQVYAASQDWRGSFRVEAPNYMRNGAEFWLNGDSALWHIKDNSPVQAVYYDTAAIQAKALGKAAQERPVYCYWTGFERYLLLGDYRDFVLYDLQKEQSRPITDLLLTDDVKRRANELLLKIAPEVYNQPEEVAAFWQQLGQEEERPPRTSYPCLAFSHYADGMLYFSLELRYYVPNSENYATHSMSIQLPLNEIFAEAI